MNSHGHDERLSAFYDGELPAVERAEVERLLSERPEMRAELAGMADLSQRLTELADEGIDFDLRAGVMEAIRARAGREKRDERREPEEADCNGQGTPVIEAATAAPLSSSLSPVGRGELNGTAGHSPSAMSHPPRPNDHGPRTTDASSAQPVTRRRWMPFVLMTCSLALLVAAILPLTMNPDHDIVAIHEPTDAPFPGAPEMVTAKAGPASADGAFVNLDGVAENSPALAMQSAVPSGSMGGSGAESNGPSALLQSIAQKRRLNPGELITQLVEVGGQAMLAEYQVVDVRRSFSQVEVLLRDKGIVPLEGGDERAESARAESDLNPTNVRVIVIDAEPNPLNEALDQFVASPENQEVMVTSLDSTSLLQEAQEFDDSKDALAKAAEMPLSPAPAAAPGAAAADTPADLPPRPEARASKMAPRSLTPDKKVVGGPSSPSMKFESPAPPSEITNDLVPKNSAAKGQLDSAAPPTVMGNSVVISNAAEVYPALEVAARNSYNSRQNTMNQGNRRSGSRAGVQDLVQQPASSVDVFSQNDQKFNQTPDLQYSQRSTNRMRQLAILILRPKPLSEPEQKSP